MQRRLADFIGREVEIWTTENTEPWMGVLKEANPDVVRLMIDNLETYLVSGKIVAFRLSEEEQGAATEESRERGEEA